MHYYPELLKDTDLVNLLVVLPGGWGTSIDEATSPAFLLECLLFAPTKSVSDPDKWLWHHTRDFWSVTSYESIRLSFTLEKSQIDDFIPVLEALLKPRTIGESFAVSEIDSLKHYWQTERDRQEDEVLRALFAPHHVVHPNPAAIDELTLEAVPRILNQWKGLAPDLIVLGELTAAQQSNLEKQFPHKNTPAQKQSYQAPQTWEWFTSPDRLGLRFKLIHSHWFELLLIELWDQVFKAKFFFEYHQDELFIWTEPLEHPHLLQQKIEQYELTKRDFESAQNNYGAFLEALYEPQTARALEKLAELAEGLHPHAFQAATYEIGPGNIDLRPKIKNAAYQDFSAFYQSFFESRSV